MLPRSAGTERRVGVVSRPEDGPGEVVAKLVRDRAPLVDDGVGNVQISAG